MAETGNYKLAAENAALRRALAFYAKHDSWMALTEDPHALNTVLVAMGGSHTKGSEGWSVAEEALAMVASDER